MSNYTEQKFRLGADLWLGAWPLQPCRSPSP